MVSADEAEQEVAHADLIGSRRVPLNPVRGAYTLSPFPVSPLFRRRGQRAAVPPAGVLRRERRALLQFREERLRDLGGLLLEMYRRDRFREELVRERCEELLELDEHLAAIDTLLGISWNLPEPPRCAAQETLTCALVPTGTFHQSTSASVTRSPST